MERDTQQLRRLMQVSRRLVTELDQERVLGHLLEGARTITGARYAALGVLSEDRTQLGRFITVGIDAAGEQAIGRLPSGRGVLGVLIERPEPLRLEDVGDHPESFGFPPGHPPMRSFLGVPIVSRGQTWGNLYLTEKAEGAPFTAADEDACVVLAEWAGTAIENARLYQRSEQRREELEQAVRGLEAARSIADAIGTEPDLERILELIVKRGRALMQARTVLIMLRDGRELRVAAAAGEAAGSIGVRLPVDGSTSGEVLERGRPERIADVGSRLRISPAALGISGARTALLVPMSHRGQGIGVLAAFDRGPERRTFSAGDEQLLRTFAASAANAVALSRSVEADRLRSQVAAAEAERRRWARELHDDTLQSLGALRVTLGGALRRGDPERLREATSQAVEDIEAEIGNLRSIISELRPMLLDDVGLAAAIEALVDRRRHDGLAIDLEVSMPERGRGPVIAPALQTTIYRLIQEALTNVVKHAEAARVRVSVVVADGQATIEVLDNGVGFNAGTPAPGFGLTGIRERTYLAGGTLTIDSGAAGTALRVRLPVAHEGVADDEGSLAS